MYASTTPSPSSTPGEERRTWALVIGVLVLIGAVVGAIGLWGAASSRYDDNIAGFARAPVGCDTTLDFDRSGEFVLYLETTGTVDNLAGSCDVAADYDRPSTGLPRPELTVRGPTGDSLALGPTGGVDYDTGEFVGTAYRLVDIASTGDHVITVGVTEGEPFAIAVGRDPNEGVALFRWGAAGLLIAGLIGGGFLLVIGSRRPAMTPAAGDPWQPTAPVGPHRDGWPLSPPGFPTPPPTTGASGPAGVPIAPPPVSGPSPWAPPGPPASS